MYLPVNQACTPQKTQERIRCLPEASGLVEIMSRARREENTRRRHRTRLPEGARRNNVQFSKRVCGCHAWTEMALEVTENMMGQSHHNHRLPLNDGPGEPAQQQRNSAPQPTHTDTRQLRAPRTRIPSHPNGHFHNSGTGTSTKSSST